MIGLTPEEQALVVLDALGGGGAMEALGQLLASALALAPVAALVAAAALIAAVNLPYCWPFRRAWMMPLDRRGQPIGRHGPRRHHFDRRSTMNFYAYTRFAIALFGVLLIASASSFGAHPWPGVAGGSACLLAAALWRA